MSDVESRAKLVMELFGLIQHEWVTTKQLQYAVIPSQDIRTLSFDEVKKITFRVGVKPEGPLAELNVRELTALFLAIRDYHQFVTSGGFDKPDAEGNVSQRFAVNLAPTDEVMRQVLSQVQFLLVVNDGGEQQPSQPEPIEKPDKYGLTNSRMQLIFGLIQRRMEGVTCKVYPPAGYLADPSLTKSNLFESLRDTSWFLKWTTGQEDVLSFMELLTFVYQIFVALQAQQDAIEAAKQNRDKAEPGQPINVSVNTRFNPADIITDDYIRTLLGKLEIESEPRPDTMLN